MYHTTHQHRDSPQWVRLVFRLLVHELVSTSQTLMVEVGTSEGSGTRRSAGGQDSAVPTPDAGPQGLFLPRLVEMHQQTRGDVEGLSATVLRLQGCSEESNRVLLQEVVPTQRGNQINTARVVTAVESLAQGSVLMGDRVQAILETQRTMGEGVAGTQEAQRSMAMVGGMWETLLAMAGTLTGILDIRQVVAVSLDNFPVSEGYSLGAPDSAQEQGQLHQFQKLSRYLPPEHCGKNICRVALSRLQILAERVHPNSSAVSELENL
ncbi:uncharacterized protein LOC144486345 [Mustelus asterias]